MNSYQDDISPAISVLEEGGIILYPTDTIWGIGCDASNASAIKRIYQLKKREETKSMIILLASLSAIGRYVIEPSPKLLDYLQRQTSPTTAIFEQAKNLPDILINDDGSIAIRIVQEPFCQELLQLLQKPLVSTSANRSGHPSPASFGEMDEVIINGVDYVVKYRQDDTAKANPSSIIKLTSKGEILKIR